MSGCDNSGGSSRDSTDLVSRMLRVLESQRTLVGDAYPLTLRRLGQLADRDANIDSIKRAARQTAFKKRVIATVYNDPAAPVALFEDLSRLAESPLTLRHVLELRTRNKTKAFTVAQLKQKLTGRLKDSLRKQFQQAVDSMIDSDRLPPGVGFVRGTNARPLLFRLEDLYPASWRDALSITSESCAEQHSSILDSRSAQDDTADDGSSSGFGEAFEAAFERIDRQQGGFNFVTLHDMRAALPQYSRDLFDDELRQLRIARQFRLSGAENRRDLTRQQREAGIQEAGSLLLYVQRASL